MLAIRPAVESDLCADFGHDQCDGGLRTEQRFLNRRLRRRRRDEQEKEEDRAERRSHSRQFYTSVREKHEGSRSDLEPSPYDRLRSGYFRAFSASSFLAAVALSPALHAASASAISFAAEP